MNEATYKKLVGNPHYRMNRSQKIDQDKKAPMVAFGSIPKNNLDMEKQTGRLPRIGITSKKVIR